MTNLSDFGERLKAHAKRVLEERDKHLISLGFDTIALTSRRVQGEGIKSDGQKFTVPYSRTKLPGFFFPEKFILYAKRNKVEMTYENYRKFIGLPTDYKNLTLSGNMWASVKGDITESTAERAVLTIKPSNREMQNRMNYNARRENTNPMAPTEEEKELMRTLTEEWFNNLNKEL